MNLTRVVFLGANGNVGSEVVTRLSRNRSIELIPVCRSPYSSTFLRHNGVSGIVHGDLRDPTVAEALRQSDVIVNSIFVGTGSPRESVRQNYEVLRQISGCANSRARIVHFSSVSVYGDLAYKPFSRVSSYGKQKRAHEKLLLKLNRKINRPLYVFRLGHVLGTLQPLSKIIKEYLSRGEGRVRLPDAGNLPSNCISTRLIELAILDIASGSKQVPGVYNLTFPSQITWREVCQKMNNNVEILPLLQDRARTRLEQLHHLIRRQSAYVATVKALLARVNIVDENRLRAKHFTFLAAQEIDQLNVNECLEIAKWAGVPDTCFELHGSIDSFLDDIEYLGRVAG